MKIKIISLLFISSILILFGENSIAQDIKIDWGKSFTSKNEISKIVGAKDNIMYAVASKKKSDFLVGYDNKNLTEKFIKEIDLPKKVYMLDMILTKTGPTLIYYSFTNKNKDLKVYARMLGKMGNKKTNKLLMHVKDTEKVKGNVLNIKVSEDKSKFVVYYTRSLAISRRERKVITEFVSFDSDLRSIEQFNHSNGDNIDEGGQVANADIQIDKNGNILYVLPVISGDREKYELFIKQFDFKGKELKETFLDTKGTFVGDAKIFLDEKNDVFRIVGLSVGLSEGYVGYTGVYSAVIDGNTLETKKSFNTTFPLDFLKKFIRAKRVDRKARKGKSIYIPGSFSINNLFVTEDGSTMFTAESFTHSIAQTSSVSASEMWIFGDVICGRLNPEGSLKWINIAKKTQIASKARPMVSLGAGGGGLSVGASFVIGNKLPAECSNYSYLAGVSEGNLILIYNDHFKLSNRDGEDGKRKALRNPKKSLVYKFVFDSETGESKRTALIKESNQGGTYLAPKVYFREDANNLLVWGRFKKTQKFGYLNF